MALRYDSKLHSDIDTRHRRAQGGTGAVYRVDTAGVRVKITKRFAENRDAKIIAIVPAALAAGTYHLEIVTQFSHSETLLKKPRTITYDVDLLVN